ncbi:DUF4168 domain-containing protein [Halomicronema hongdechloris]|nr:DUF4168 domain-containing protein [Halomicronema hongdechloris]
MGRYGAALRSVTIASAVAMAAVASGLSWQPPTSTSLPTMVPATAWAQATVSDDEVMSYARAVLQMEGPRTTTYTEIKDLLMQVDVDINQIDMSCTSTRNLNRVPRRLRSQVRELLVNYCNRAQEIVEANGLTPQIASIPSPTLTARMRPWPIAFVASSCGCNNSN